MLGRDALKSGVRSRGSSPVRRLKLNMTGEEFGRRRDAGATRLYRVRMAESTPPSRAPKPMTESSGRALEADGRISPWSLMAESL
jgi:hypothetical protein